MIHGASGTDPAVRGAGRGDLLSTFVRAPLEQRTQRAILAVPLGFGIEMLAIATVSAFFSAGGSVLIWLVGIPIVGVGIECSRLFARAERWRMTYVDGRPMQPHAYRPFDAAPRRPYGAWVRQWAEAEFLDEHRWRDVVYILVSFPVTAVEFMVWLALWAAAFGLLASPLVFAGLRSAGVDLTVAGFQVDSIEVILVLMAAGLLLIPVAAFVSRGLLVMHHAVVEGLLCESPNAALRRDLERLRGSRSAAIELEASELRRIERDLHDGAQQRLIVLAIDLGLAADRLESDPAAARSLVDDAREQARLALAELRDLVRGTAPSILLDRGLVAALAAVAGSCPVPTVLDGNLAAGERLPPAVERAAYFVVVEALANVAKHSSATRCDVILRREREQLLVEVRDDGTGGATVSPGGGLAGLRDRVQALDGTLEVTSPAGGPTVVCVALPAGPEPVIWHPDQGRRPGRAPVNGQEAAPPG